MKKSVISVLSALTGALTGATVGAKLVEKQMSEEKKKAQSYADKHLSLYLLMNQWVKAKQDGKNLSSYFEKKGYKNIAIYGMNYVGETLLTELRGTGIQVAYGIDKRADVIYVAVDVVTMDDDLGDVDAVVVTAITFFEEIEEELSKKVNCPIISLEDVLLEV